MNKDQMVVELDFRTKVLLWSGLVIGSLATGILGYAVVRYRSSLLFLLESYSTCNVLMVLYFALFSIGDLHIQIRGLMAIARLKVAL